MKIVQNYENNTVKKYFLKFSTSLELSAQQKSAKSCIDMPYPGPIHYCILLEMPEMERFPSHVIQGPP